MDKKTSNASYYTGISELVESLEYDDVPKIPTESSELGRKEQLFSLARRFYITRILLIYTLKIYRVIYKIKSTIILKNKFRDELTDKSIKFIYYYLDNWNESKPICNKSFDTAFYISTYFNNTYDLSISPIEYYVRKGINNNHKPLNWYESVKDDFIIVTCAFKFDEYVNQRPINVAKYYASKGYKVLYTYWDWDGEELDDSHYFEEVYKNIYQLPFSVLEKNYKNITNAKQTHKILYLTFSPIRFVRLVQVFRSMNFKIHYDVMDDWRGFSELGQASWYEEQIDYNLVKTSDTVSAVSNTLIEKYSSIRDDIILSPNGYYKHLVGAKNMNIASSTSTKIGYFGHLTESWFDWDMLFGVASSMPEYNFEIIGYGASEKTLKKCNKYKNIQIVGKVKSSELYKYVKDWKVGIIPFKNIELVNCVDPIKIYEYIYYGLYCVTMGMPHLDSYPNTKNSNTKKEFIEYLNYYMRKDDNCANTDRFLNLSTWDSRLDALDSEITKSTGYRGLYD